MDDIKKETIKSEIEKLLDLINKEKKKDKKKIKEILETLIKKLEPVSIDDKKSLLTNDQTEEQDNDGTNVEAPLEEQVDESINQFELSEIKKSLSRIENNDLAEKKDITEVKDKLVEIGSNLRDVATKSNSTYWDMFKKSLPKTNYSDIYSKITSAKNSITNEVRKHGNETEESLTNIASSIASSKSILRDIVSTTKTSKSSLSGEINELKNKVNDLKTSRPKDYLKEEDFKFELKTKFKEFDGLREVGEELEALPKKLQDIESKLINIDEKLENIPNSSSASLSEDVPKEEKSITELAKFMVEGISQLENISRLYVSKKDSIENLGKLKQKHLTEIENTQKSSLSEGESIGRIAIAKEIADKFPTEFKLIKSIFSDIIKEEFSVNETLIVTNENKNKLMPYIKNQVNLGAYKVLKQALLLDNKIIFKAEIEVCEQEQEKVLCDNEVSFASVPSEESEREN